MIDVEYTFDKTSGPWYYEIQQLRARRFLVSRIKFLMALAIRWLHITEHIELA